MAHLSSHALRTLARDVNTELAPPRASSSSSPPTPSVPPLATCAASATKDARSVVVVVGYADGALASFADESMVHATHPARACGDTRCVPTWVCDPPRGAWDVDDDGAPRRGCDAACVSGELSRVVRCCGAPPAIEVLDLNCGNVLRRLSLPTAWPCGGACAVSACGIVGGTEYCYVASEKKWNHSGDEFMGNSATCAVWHIAGDLKDATACAVFAVNAKRARTGGGIAEAKTLAPFAGLTSIDGGVEFVTVTVNFDEQKMCGEHVRYCFNGDSRGRTVQPRDEAPIAIDMGWMPKHRVAMSRALDEDARSMPSMPSCVITRQYIVTIWCDGERPVCVVDRKSERPNDSRKFLLDALRRNVERCVASPNTSVVRLVIDARAYDDDAYLALVLRDTPVLKPGQTAQASEVDYKFILMPTGFKSGSASLSKMPTFMVKPLIDIAHIERPAPTLCSCAICLDEIKDENVVFVPCCRASFCDECLTAYMSLAANKGCPLCRDVKAFWMNASTVLLPTDATSAASFEVQDAIAIRSHLRTYRVLEQDVSLGDYAALDEQHLRGDRPPFTCVRGCAPDAGRVYTLCATTVEVRALTTTSGARAMLATI